MIEMSQAVMDSAKGTPTPAVTVKVKSDLHAEIDQIAKSEYTTVGRWIEKVLRETLEKRKARKR